MNWDYARTAFKLYVPLFRFLPILFIFATSESALPFLMAIDRAQVAATGTGSHEGEEALKLSMQPGSMSAHIGVRTA